MSDTWRRSFAIGGFLLGSVVVACLVVLLAGRNPWLALTALFQGAFGSTYAFLNVWTKTVPLLLTGLAVTIAFRARFWNIGAEGQFMAGAIAAAAIGTIRGLPAVAHVPLVLAGSFAAGALWAGLAAWLKLRRGALEVISTIMLNFVALYLLSWLVHGPMMMASAGQPIGEPIAESAALPRLFGRGYTLHAGLLIALAAVWFGHVFLFRSERGFQIRMVGENPRAAAWAGIDVDRTIYRAALLSGGVAGIAGAVEILGVLGRLFDKVSPGYGFTAIAVALLARLHPLALIPAALFFGALDAGASRLQQGADVSHVLVLVIQAIVILATVASGIALRRRAA